MIAEKFEAIVSLGNANTRYKDFYDIYILAKRYDLDGKELQKAVFETFEHRETGFNDIIAFEPKFTESDIHQKRWKAFVRKKEALADISFAEAIALLQQLMKPVVESIKNREPFEHSWESIKGSWS